jgi:hypothetical protein
VPTTRKHITTTARVQVQIILRHQLLKKQERRRKSCSWAEGLRILGLTLEPLRYHASSVLNAVPDGLRRPFDGPLHHRLQGDGGVTTSEAHQHVVSHRLCQSVTFLLQAAADSLLQPGYLPPGRIKKGKYDVGIRSRVPSSDRVEAEGCQSSICLTQEAPDTLPVASLGGLEVLQSLSGDGQLLHLVLRQLPLPGSQPGLLVPPPCLPTIRVELAGQDLGTGVLQSFPLLLEVGLKAVDAGLAGAPGLKLAAEGDVVQLLSLLQLPLQLLHLPRLLVDLACTHSMVFLLLDDGASHASGDGLHLQVEAMLPSPHRRPLGHRHPPEHVCPQLEALALINEVPTFAVQDAMHLGQGLVSRAHGLT